MRDKAWFVRLYGEIIIDGTGTQTMLYFTCTMIYHYGVFHAEDGVSVDCGTSITGILSEELQLIISF